MRRFLIPISMVIGCILGIIFRGALNLGIDIAISLGAVAGIIIGSIIQSIVNEITPDEYFINSSKVEKIKNWKKIQVENLDEEDNLKEEPAVRVGNREKLINRNNDSLGDTKVLNPIRQIPQVRDSGRISVPPPKENISQVKKKAVVIEEEDD